MEKTAIAHGPLRRNVVRGRRGLRLVPRPHRHSRRTPTPGGASVNLIPIPSAPALRPAL